MSDYFSNIRTYSITCRIHWSTSAKQLWFTDNACNERYLCFPHAAVCLDFWVFYKTVTIEGTIQKVIETTEIVYCLSSHWHSHTACFYGGGNIFIRSMAISLFCIVVSALPVLLENTFIGYPAKMESQMDCRNIHFYKYFCRFH